jgi:GAF domain-containing protein
MLDTDLLIRQVVELIRNRFELYYVGLFLVDEAGEWAVLRAGTGKAGQAMLARGHRIRVGEGMIGWSVANLQARIASKAEADAVRLVTSELPDTRSEAALPLRSRGRIIGALTVQDDKPDVFDEDIINVLQAMADQVAVALDNARLFAESQQLLETERRAFGEASRDAWRQLALARPDLSYVSNESDVVSPAGRRWLPVMVQASQTGETTWDGGSTVVIPIKIRERVEGVIRLRKPDGAGRWTEGEIDLMETLAVQLSAALESARLYRDTQQRAVRDRLVGDLTARMRETLDLEIVLETAVQGIGEALGLEALDVRLLEPDSV